MYSYTFWSSSSGANYRSDLPIDASHVGIQKETTPPKKPVDSLSTSSLLQRQYVPSSNHVSAFPILCPFFSLPSPSYLEHGLTRTRNGSDHPHSALSTRLGGGTNNRSMLRRSTERTSSPVESTRGARHPDELVVRQGGHGVIVWGEKVCGEDVLKGMGMMLIETSWMEPEVETSVRNGGT